MSRRDYILAEASDAALSFIAYDRQEDEEFPLGEVEAAVEAGEITVEDILAAFAKTLREQGQFRSFPTEMVVILPT